MALTDVWFVLIAVLWTGYFVLEGFDFGVGMLLPVLGRDDAERRILINSIGPVWDGNEVWLLVAGGATFAAFPEWYATLFSGFYLPLLIILLSLIVRGVAFEFRGKSDNRSWRANWDHALVVGSLVPALLWGVAFGNIVRGVPIDKAGTYTGGFFTLLNPYALIGGITTLTIFLLHGAIFLALKTTGELRRRARVTALRIGLAAAAAAVAFLAWTQVDNGTVSTAITALAAAGCLVGALVSSWRSREGWAFLLNAAAIALATATLVTALYPNVMPSSTNPAYNLTTTNASSTHYTLQIMTVVAAIFTPVVVAYQSWSYWVFRRRIGLVDLAEGGSGKSAAAPGLAEDRTP
ncbi:MAG TPA: cytochrome d ubiquinol oxidase subunit II [Mycobacteriales bacterium]|nr:cytochrome d ubiquinol oxidase subunit II [Mycobacteriales bacterium]